MEAYKRIKRQGWDKTILPNAHKLDADDFKEFCDGMLRKMSKPTMRMLNSLFTDYALEMENKYNRHPSLQKLKENLSYLTDRLTEEEKTRHG